jgi:hypothetical protein
MLTSIFYDLRYALRALLRHRNFTAAALLTLAIGTFDSMSAVRDVARSLDKDALVALKGELRW